MIKEEYDKILTRLDGDVTRISKAIQGTTSVYVEWQKIKEFSLRDFFIGLRFYSQHADLQKQFQSAVIAKSKFIRQNSLSTLTTPSC